MNVAPVAPLLAVAAAAVVVVAVAALRRSDAASETLASLGLLAAAALTPWAAAHAPAAAGPLLRVDLRALVFVAVLAGAGLAVVLLAHRYFRDRIEFSLLVLLGTLGSMVLACANHVAALALGLELAGVSLYGMLAYNDRSLQAGLKYLVLAASASAFVLFGGALLYAATGALEFDAWHDARSGVAAAGFAMVLAGAGFKLAVAPFHLWAPDVYQGSPAPATMFLATASKVGVVAVLLRILVDGGGVAAPAVWWSVAAASALSMIAGNLVALFQARVKRILAGSSIAHFGYLLVAFLAGGEAGADAATAYAVAYAITALGAFGVVCALSTEGAEADSLDDYRALFSRRPVLAAVFTAMLLSLAGMPLTAGFVAKFHAIAAGADAKLWWLLMLLAAGSLAGVFYYLRVVATMLAPAPPFAREEPRIGVPAALALAAVTAAVIAYGLYGAAPE